MCWGSVATLHGFLPYFFLGERTFHTVYSRTSSFQDPFEQTGTVLKDLEMSVLKIMIFVIEIAL